MIVATYNCASVRARLPRILAWLDEVGPDVLALQETKVEDGIFPREPFEERGYALALNGQKSWNGVATLTRLGLQGEAVGFADDLWKEDARILTVLTGDVKVINTYVPNGSEVGSDKWRYKLGWMDRFARFLEQRFKLDEPLVWLGDVNVAPTSLDVYDSGRFYGGVGHHPDEFARLEKIVRFGLTDCYRHLYPDVRQYTFWDFTLPRAVDRNLGWRIDHIYVTPPMLARLEDCWVDVEARRGEKPSDHTYVVARFA